jgi:hypothetical protein
MTTTASEVLSTDSVLTIGGEPQPGAAGSYPIHNPARPAEIVGHAPAGRDGARLYTREHGKVLTEANFELSTGPGLAGLI